MSTHALEVRLREGAERIGVTRLTETLTQVKVALEEIDRVYLYSRTPRPEWVVQQLAQQGHDLLVRLTARESRGREWPSLVAPLNALVAGVETLQREPELPQYYTESTLERLLKIGEPGAGVQEVSLATVNGTVGHHFPISEPVRQNARQAVAGAYDSLGSVAGWLDEMNARRVAKGVLRVGLYDPLTRRAVTGVLAPDMEAAMQRFWRQRVLARGLITRNKRGQIVRIRIDHIEPLPQDDDKRAAVSELLGADPDWLGGQDVDAYLHEERRA
ncbi:hypothetical protein [Sphaerisporangium sp. NPDC051011]|uniref:hypothetical protein n=1 Tax=Sphaerisporangium sp. NPDC051011 TaxID=3155792 RepID=UPI0033D240EC